MIPNDLSSSSTGLDAAIVTSPDQTAAARLTVAERAIRDGWSRDELVDVLGSLGLA